MEPQSMSSVKQTRQNSAWVLVGSPRVAGHCRSQEAKPWPCRIRGAQDTCTWLTAVLRSIHSCLHPLQLNSSVHTVLLHATGLKGQIWDEIREMWARVQSEEALCEQGHESENMQRVMLSTQSNWIPSCSQELFLIFQLYFLSCLLGFMLRANSITRWAKVGNLAGKKRETIFENKLFHLPG